MELKEIKTKRLLLRELRESDADAIAEYMNDEEIARYIPGPPYPYTKKDALWFIDDCHKKFSEDKRTEWGIEFERQIVGSINLHDFEKEDRTCMVGYLISRAQHRKGICSEALQAVLVYAFDELNVRRVAARVFSGNGPSMRLLEKFGFVQEGTFRKEKIVRNEIHDTICYGLLKEEWQR